MTPSEIVDGNKKIARFMGFEYFPLGMEGVTDPGWKTHVNASSIGKFNSFHNMFMAKMVWPDGTVSEVAPRKENNKLWVYLCRSHNSLQYHTNWQWLMPVYIKICEFFKDDNHWVNNDDEIIIIYNIMYERLGDGDGIEEVWNWIVKFIDHYNQKT